jgi:alkylation response protein AidB-like acyl-CoA dehydrogenase
MVTWKAVQIVGGRSAHRRYPLERLFRDVRTATLMPPNVDRSLS